MESTSTSSNAAEAVTVSVEAAGGGGGDRLQRHRSLHSPSKVQSRNGNRSQKFDNNNTSSNHHRRATSVRVRPTYLLEDEDPSLPKPPVSINVACPDDEVEDSVNTLGHRYITHLIIQELAVEIFVSETKINIKCIYTANSRKTEARVKWTLEKTKLKAF